MQTKRRWNGIQQEENSHYRVRHKLLSELNCELKM